MLPTTSATATSTEQASPRSSAAAGGSAPRIARQRRTARRAGWRSRSSRERARSRRRRTWPIATSSPKPSGATAATGRPLTNVPLVLPRSSTYQLRPRYVSTACSAEANGSSTTIALLTSRPSVVMASRSNERPAAGLAARRLDDDQPAERRRRARGPPRAGRAAAPARPGTGRRTGAPGTGAGRSRRSRSEAVHQVHVPGRPRRRARVSPSSIRSPAPSTSSPTAHAVDARAVGAAEVGVDERAAPAGEPGVVARDAAVGEDEVVVGGPADGQAVPSTSIARSRRPAADDAQAGAPGRSAGAR